MLKAKKKNIAVYRIVAHVWWYVWYCQIPANTHSYLKKILIYGVHFHGLCHCSVTKTFNFKCDSWARCPFVVRIFRTFKFSGTISQESAWAEVVSSVLLIQRQFGTIQTLVVTVHMDLSGQQLGVKASTVHSDYVHFLFIRGFIVFWHSSWF